MPSNIKDIEAALRGIADSLDLTRGVGKDVLAHLAVKISDRARNESGPSGDEWPANRGRYGEKKRAVGLPVGAGLKHGSGARMLSLQEIQGQVEIKPDSARMGFGTAADTINKGQWFTAGSTSTPDAERSGAKNQPPRPFYEITDEDAEEVFAMMEKAVEDHLRTL